MQVALAVAFRDREAALRVRVAELQVAQVAAHRDRVAVILRVVDLAADILVVRLKVSLIISSTSEVLGAVVGPEAGSVDDPVVDSLVVH